MSPAEPGANPGEPSHEGTAPPPGPGPAAGWRPREAEVSYNVTAELRGQGIASRALQAFLAWAAQQIGLRRAHLACHTGNLASRRVAEKCGFVLVGQQGEEYQFQRDLGPKRPV